MDAAPTVKYFSTLAACSCPDWKFRRRTPTDPCKHVRRLKEAERLLREQAAYNRRRGVSPRRTLPTMP